MAQQPLLPDFFGMALGIDFGMALGAALSIDFLAAMRTPEMTKATRCSDGLADRAQAHAHMFRLIFADSAGRVKYWVGVSCFIAKLCLCVLISPRHTA